jgi:ADP-ribosyl-[dinitrogen reductase] hydrolase
MNLGFLDRARGALLGSAIGDAMGATNEFKTREAILETGIVSDLVGGGWLNLEPGEITDDTEMTLCILEAYADGYNLERVAQNFTTWLDSKPKDIGNLTRAALQELKRGKSPRDAGRIAWEASGHTSAGNGAIMRACPTALLRHNDREARVVETIEIARITHWDQRAIEAAIWLNAALAALCNDAIHTEALDYAKDEIAFARAHNDWKAPSDDVLQWVSVAPTLEAKQLDTSGYALAQVAAWTLHSAQNFHDGLVLAINQGGDADTIGAVAGALLGAKFGVSSIPTNWLGTLKARAKLDQLLKKAFEHADIDTHASRNTKRSTKRH